MGLEADLKKVGTFLVTEITTELARKQKRASGRLLKSFKSKLNTISDGFEIAVMAESYFKFVDEGVNGRERNRGSKYSYKNKKPPIAPLLEWVKIKSIASGDRAARNAAFAIQTYIWKNGFKGLNILEETLKKASDEYLDKINDAMFNTINIKIDNIIKNGNNNR